MTPDNSKRLCRYHLRNAEIAKDLATGTSTLKTTIALTEAVVSAIHPSNRLCVTDKKNGYLFLVDTDANICVISK